MSQLPSSQFVPINPGGQTQTPDLSSHIPPLRQSGQSLEHDGRPHLLAIQPNQEEKNNCMFRNNKYIIQPL